MPEISPSKYLVQASMKDVPHLDEKAREEILSGTPPHLRQAREDGDPAQSAGAIYRTPLDQILVDPFRLPDYWPRAYGLDVATYAGYYAAVWGAHDRTTDTVYLYTEHYRKNASPADHVAAIQARGDWIPGVIDPAANGMHNLEDGIQLTDNLRSFGLNLENANNDVEAGINAVSYRLQTGRLKVFRTLQNWQQEYRLYRREIADDGTYVKIVKKNDHLMDACVVGETTVVTDQGHVAIADLVGRDGHVVTRSGAMARFIGARRTIVAAPVVRVTFDDGREVICTPDHPFLTPKGWVQARDMAGRSCYDAVSQRIQWRSWWKSRSFRTRSRSSAGFATTAAGSISSATASGCIERSGLRRTGAASRMGITSIIATKIRRTMSRAISCSWSAPITCLFISPVTAGAFLGKPSRPRASGIAATQALLGIARTMTGTRMRSSASARSSANNAEPGSRQRSEAPTAFARTPARHGFGSRLVSTTRNALAWSAASLLWLIATSRSTPARAAALVRCRSVADAGRRDVYCLTVPGTSAFAIEGGLVVHNTRYLLCPQTTKGSRTSGMARAQVVPVQHSDMIDAMSRVGDPVAGY